MVITTERENLESSGKAVPTTRDVLFDWIKAKGHPEWLEHLHYPRFNTVVSPQLNYAIEEIRAQQFKRDENPFMAVYNADSVVDTESLRCLHTIANRDALVSQQSSHFLWNLPELLKRRQFLTAGFGLYQSGWTLQHEIPRLLFSPQRVWWLPRFITKNGLVHCVSHGLLVKLSVLDKSVQTREYASTSNYRRLTGACQDGTVTLCARKV